MLGKPGIYPFCSTGTKGSRVRGIELHSRPQVADESYSFATMRSRY